MESLRDLIRRLVKERALPPEANLPADDEPLPFDSLSLWWVLAGIEEALGVMLMSSRLADLHPRSIGDLIRMVEAAVEPDEGQRRGLP